MTTQFQNELKALQRKLETDQEQLRATVPGSDAERIMGCCVAVRAQGLFTLVKEHHPELRG